MSSRQCLYLCRPRMLLYPLLLCAPSVILSFISVSMTLLREIRRIIMFKIVNFHILFNFLLMISLAQESRTTEIKNDLIIREGIGVRGSTAGSQFRATGSRHEEQGLGPHWRRPRRTLSPQKIRSSVLFSRYVSHPIPPIGGNVAINTGEWVMRFIWVESGFPTQVASGILQFFYQSLLELADQKFGHGDVMAFASLHVVNFYLDFQCDSSVLSWDFIRQFLIRMLNATERGFTGRFIAILLHGPSQSLVKVTFRIIAQELR